MEDFSIRYGVDRQQQLRKEQRERKTPPIEYSSPYLPCRHDICFSIEFGWENAHEYGFILLYPESKEEITGTAYAAWHYRYVGVDSQRK